MATPVAEDLFRRIEKMSPADQLKLAAGFIDEAARNKPKAAMLLKYAKALTDRVGNELSAVLMLMEGKRDG